MRVGRLTTFVAVTAALAALAVTPALSSPGKKIGDGQDDGLPGAFAKGRVLKPKKIFVRIDAEPNEPVEVVYDTNCSRRAKGKVREGEFTVTGTGLTRLNKAYKRPDDCLVNVLAAYENAALSGTIRIRIYARVWKK